MQITITGPRGCGKTTVAIEVAKFLKERGCAVTVFGYSRSDTFFLKREVRRQPKPESMNHQLPVVIDDSFIPTEDAFADTWWKNLVRRTVQKCFPWLIAEQIRSSADYKLPVELCQCGMCQLKQAEGWE